MTLWKGQDAKDQTAEVNMTFLNENKVVLGLSGGVDSTLTALKLKEMGLSVTGVYLNVLNDKEGEEEAKKSAGELDIPLMIKDIKEDFDHKVIEYFQDEYLKGRTPNPCVVCNPDMKFSVLREVADTLSIKYIATGHYAKTYYDVDLEKWFIKKAVSEERDQSYMLYRLTEDIISRLLMPLGDVTDKEVVRREASKANLSNAGKRDSQEICFLREGQVYTEFLKEKGLVTPPGPFLDIEGKVIGKHEGISNYTIGQRKGLGGTFGKPMFVKEIRRDDNSIVLSDEEQDLFSYKITSSDNILRIPFEGLKVMGKIRYKAKASPCYIRLLENNKIEALFDEPQRAATPGQSIVFYLEDYVIGGGFID